MSSLAVVLTVAAIGCGAGGGTERFLEPGPHTSAPPSENVLYVSVAHGDRVLALRLGTDGLLPAAPFSEIELTRPRELLLADDVLYVSLRDEVVSIQLEPDGSLPGSITSRTRPSFNSDPTEMILRNGVLYVAVESARAVVAHRLESGHVTEEILASGSAPGANYRTIALDDENAIIYAGTRSNAQVDAYLISPDGTIGQNPILQLVSTDIFGPEDILVEKEILYAIEQERERINAYELDTTGLLPEDPDSHTDPAERYADLIIEGDRLYATAFNRGRIDMYILEPDGSLPAGRPAAMTDNDTGSFPNDMVLANGLLYVAQGGLDRVDAYVLGSDGAPPPLPSSSTERLSSSSLATGFPNAMVIGSFPLAP